MVAASQPSPGAKELSQCCGCGQGLYCAMSRSRYLVCARGDGSGDKLPDSKLAKDVAIAMARSAEA
jgi:hypothetical protein